MKMDEAKKVKLIKIIVLAVIIVVAGIGYLLSQ